MCINLYVHGIFSSEALFCQIVILNRPFATHFTKRNNKRTHHNCSQVVRAPRHGTTACTT